MKSVNTKNHFKEKDKIHDLINYLMTLFFQKMFRILQRNFQACVEAAQRNLSPSDRVRHNEANGITPNVPDSRDLGYLVREMANTVQAYSFQMSQLSGPDLKSLNLKLLKARLKV